MEEKNNQQIRDKKTKQLTNDVQSQHILYDAVNVKREKQITKARRSIMLHYPVIKVWKKAWMVVFVKMTRL